MCPRRKPHENRTRGNTALLNADVGMGGLFPERGCPLPWLVSASEVSRCFCPYEALETRARHIPGDSNCSCSGHLGNHLCCQSSQSQSQLGSYSGSRQHSSGFRVSDLMVSSGMETTRVLDS